MLHVSYIYNTEQALSTNNYVPSSSQCYKDFENDDCCLHFPKVTDNRQKHRVQQTLKCTCLCLTQALTQSCSLKAHLGKEIVNEFFVFFLLPALRFLSLVFPVLSEYGFLYICPAWGSWCFLNLWLDTFQEFWKILSHYLFICLLCPVLSVLIFFLLELQLHIYLMFSPIPYTSYSFVYFSPLICESI